MLKTTISPVDQCGCGDTGYLTSRNISIALNDGAGKIINVPVYSCNSSMCGEYTIPSGVAGRLDEIAEEMEAAGLFTKEFSWHATEKEETPDYQASLIEGFIWKFHRRAYEDAQVILVISGDTVLLQSKIEPSEYYILKLLEESKGGIYFSFSKFYMDDEEITYEKYLDLDPTRQKELGILKMEEVEDLLIEEFGEMI